MCKKNLGTKFTIIKPQLVVEVAHVNPMGGFLVTWYFWLFLTRGESRVFKLGEQLFLLIGHMSCAFVIGFGYDSRTQ